MLSRTISGRGQLQKSPRKSSRWDLFPVPDCVTSIRRAQLRIAFCLRKNNGPRKPELLCITCDCCHLNQARTRATRPGPGPVQISSRIQLGHYLSRFPHSVQGNSGNEHLLPNPYLHTHESLSHRRIKTCAVKSV
jgi:hypothetical protein